MTEFPATFLKVTSTVHLVLVSSFLTALATSPLVLLVFGTDLTQTWFAVVLASPLAAPALFATFATFRAHADGDLQPARTWVRTWPGGVARTWRVGAAGAALLFVVAVDATFTAATPLFTAMAPFLALLVASATVTGVTLVAALEEFPGLRLWPTTKASLFCAVRGGGWSLLTLAALGVHASLLATNAFLALTLATGPVLYVLWANARHALAPVRREVERADEVGRPSGTTRAPDSEGGSTTNPSWRLIGSTPTTRGTTNPSRRPAGPTPTASDTANPDRRPALTTTGATR
ncbi:MAG: hypothetical protein LBS56_11220 [Propionibacteriaceae bacterium]|jgi:hypothetical protein|nr:hypothetical protein [Propionibacteriaceae bacterium]